MLIRSQDKRTLVNLDNVARITIEQISNSDYRIGAGYNYIGTYSTEEKAIKVLDMIQQNYERRWEVFQMPQDSEV